MSNPVPINPDVLRWARETAGLSPDDVAKKLGRKTIDSKTIESWEEGESSPSYPQLVSLAYDIYKRPLAVFFFSSVPKEETPETEFRTLPDTAIDDLPTNVIKLFRKAKLYQIYLSELLEEKVQENVILKTFKLELSTPIDSFAGKLREALGISIKDQAKWRSTAVAFKTWRKAFEDRGIFVFKDAFRDDRFSGFCLYDESYPIIFINNSMPISRQIFTLFHELGHLLFRAGGIDFRRKSDLPILKGHFDEIEVTCNRFASEFLVPQHVLSSFGEDYSEEHLDELSSFFSVSREVILRKYLEKGIVDPDYYDEMTEKWIRQARSTRKEKSGGNYYFSKKEYLGEGYINLAFRQYYRNKISSEFLAEYLGIKPCNLQTFEHVIMEGGKF